MSHALTIPTGTLSQVQKALKGVSSITIDNDVQGIAKRLYEIDPSLRLQASEDDGEMLWLVIQLTDDSGNPDPNGPKENFVTSMKGDLDHRLVQRMEKVAGRGYDLVAEMEKAEAEADAIREAERREQMGPIAEHMMHALRKDFGIRNKISMNERNRRG